MLERVKLMITDIKISYYAHKSSEALHKFIVTDSGDTVAREYWKDRYLTSIEKLTKHHCSKTNILASLI